MSRNLLFYLALAATALTAANTRAKAIVEKSAPAFQLPTLAGGTVSLTDLKGRIVVVDFWAEWCEPCRQELPELEKLSKKFTPTELTIVGINLDQRRANAEKLAKRLALSFTVALDPSGDTAEKYDLDKMPSLFLIDQNGVIRFAESGFDGPASIQALEQQIKKLLPKK